MMVSPSLRVAEKIWGVSVKHAGMRHQHVLAVLLAMPKGLFTLAFAAQRLHHAVLLLTCGGQLASREPRGSGSLLVYSRSAFGSCSPVLSVRACGPHVAAAQRWGSPPAWGPARCTVPAAAPSVCCLCAGAGVGW